MHNIKKIKLTAIYLLITGLFCLLGSVVYAKNTITLSDVKKAQQQWAVGVVAIGKAYAHHENYNVIAKKLLNKLYAYNYKNGVVLFKPTKAAQIPFRKTKESALSYFIGDNAKFSEDKGFALQPWTNVVFHNDEIYFHGDIAIAMGEYFFTEKNGHITKVKYTFGYIKKGKGQLRIILHHSSLPYTGN